MADALLDRLRHVTSRQNSLVKELRHASTQAEATDDGYIAVEGMRVLEEALRSGLRLKAVFFAESAQDRAKRLLPQIAAHTETLSLPDEVFRSCCSTDNPQGVAALAKIKPVRAEDVLDAPDPLILGSAGVQDPGNFGTMIRSAEAFGATAVLAGEGTVSEMNPKVARASAGSLFRLPVLRLQNSEIVSKLRDHGIRLAATSSHKGVALDEADLRGPLAIFVGSEGAGIPKELLGEVDEMIIIPHSTRVESLNVGIASSILLYEAARQRRRGEG
ncbi:MAG TPA: RNA methyltransferase [Terriglobales bacterium]